MGQKQLTSKNTLPVWKSTDEYIQFNPPRNHPSYKDWIKFKESQNEKANGRSTNKTRTG